MRQGLKACRLLFAVLVISVSTFSSVGAFASDEDRAAAMKLFETKQDIKVWLADHDKIEDFTSISGFDHHYPIDFCDITIGHPSNVGGATSIQYKCPAFYKGVPMNFKFVSDDKTPYWTLTSVERDGKNLSPALLTLFVKDPLIDGLGSFQKLFADTRQDTVVVRRSNGSLKSYGKLNIMIKDLRARSYVCYIDRQALPDFRVLCTY